MAWTEPSTANTPAPTSNPSAHDRDIRVDTKKCRSGDALVAARVQEAFMAGPKARSEAAGERGELGRQIGIQSLEAGGHADGEDGRDDRPLEHLHPGVLEHEALDETGHWNWPPLAERPPPLGGRVHT